jgi:hypothetical protein
MCVPSPKSSSAGGTVSGFWLLLVANRKRATDVRGLGAAFDTNDFRREAEATRRAVDILNMRIRIQICFSRWELVNERNMVPTHTLPPFIAMAIAFNSSASEIFFHLD